MPSKISRRQFVTASGLFAVWAALAACQPKITLGSGSATATQPAPTLAPSPTLAPGQTATAGATPGVEATGEPLLAHVLRRLTFGAPPELVDHARSLGVEAFIDEQLHPERLDDSRTEQMLTPLTTLVHAGRDKAMV